MLSERIIVRTKTNLSYAGEICKRLNTDEDGITIKPSKKSDIKIWFPMNEVQCLIKMNGNVVEGEELINECGLY